jgi:porin
MKYSGFIAGLALLAAMPQSAQAQESLLDQSSLLDVPGGPKQALKDAGIDLGVSVTQFYQGLVQGEGDKDWESGGKTDVVATFNGEKLGLWQGLFVNVHGEFVYGNDVNAQGDGTVLPINTALAFPALGGYDTDISLVVTQAFSEAASLSAGKFNMLDAAAKTPLVGGGGIDTFMNISLAAPVSGVTPPYILGGIFSYKTEPANFTVMVYDPRNAQDSGVIEHPFADGVTTSLSVTVPVEIGGLKGYQGVRGVYSTLQGLDLNNIPQIVLPPESQDIETKDGYWYFSYSFQQYLVQDPADPRVGWGVFGQIAVSDGNPNPMQWSGYIGVGGTSFIADRPDDRFGIAYFYDGLSGDLKDGLDALSIDLGDEQGIEAFYNYAATPWLRLTANAQVIDPSLSDDTAIFLGLRAQLKLF